MLINILIICAVIAAVIVWIAMTKNELPEDKLDESAKVEEHSDNEE